MKTKIDELASALAPLLSLPEAVDNLFGAERLAGAFNDARDAVSGVKRLLVELKDHFDEANKIYVGSIKEYEAQAKEMRMVLEEARSEVRFAGNHKFADRIDAALSHAPEQNISPQEVVVCGKRCDHGSECLKLPDHEGGHDTQHGCMFYDTTSEKKPGPPLQGL